MANNEKPQITALKLLIPGNGWEQEVFVPTEFVRSVILPAVEHEIGHIVTAAHFGAVIFGIGVGFIPKRSTDGMFFQAIYGWEECPTETQCIVKAAGPAADLLYRGRIDDRGAKGDLSDIEALTGVRSLEPYLSQATELLSGYRSEIAWVAERLRAALIDGQWRRMIRLPNGPMVALFINEAELRECP
jgi:hypothetical protein